MLFIFSQRQAEADEAKYTTGAQLSATYRGEIDEINKTGSDTLHKEYNRLAGRAALYVRGGRLDKCTTLAEATKTLIREIADIKGYLAESTGPFDEQPTADKKPFYAGYLAEAEAALDLISDLNIVD